MYMSRYKSSGVDDNTITFPLLECWNPMTKVATVAAQVGGRRVMCRISFKLLKKKFKAIEDQPMVSVSQNRTVIELAARKLIENQSFEEDGSIMIRDTDI